MTTYQAVLLILAVLLMIVLAAVAYVTRPPALYTCPNCTSILPEVPPEGECPVCNYEE